MKITNSNKNKNLILPNVKNDSIVIRKIAKILLEKHGLN